MQLGPAKLHATFMATCRQLQLEVIAINLYMWVGGVHKQKVNGIYRQFGHVAKLCHDCIHVVSIVTGQSWHVATFS